MLNNNFSEKTITVLNLAKEESRRLGHNFVGSEQLLLGLLGVNTVATQLLYVANVSLDAARVEVEKFIGRGSGIIPEIGAIRSVVNSVQSA